MKPLDISVVIPAWNSARTIEAALRSVAVQSVAVREVLVVDDCASDTTVAVAERVALDGDLPLRIITQERNAGPAAARNAGVAAAASGWIAFLDADDAWLPHRLAVQSDLLRNRSDVGMVCGDTVGWDAEPPAAVDGGLEADVRPVSLREFAFGNPVATSTVLLRKQVFAAAGGFDVQFRGPEDYDLWMRVAASHTILKTEMPLSRYRHVPGSLSMDDRTFLPQVLRVLDKAFSPGGALYAMKELRTVAESTQYWNASWMAFDRGARMTAARYWRRAYAMNLRAVEPAKRKWWPLLLRYLAGRRVGVTG